MRRLGMFAAVGALILGSALPALAQPPPALTVTWSGEFRIVGFVSDNVSDFTDTAGNAFKDSQAGIAQRFRLFTTITSADKKARVVWGLEIGDITWGNGGGASGQEWGGPCQTAPGAVCTNPSGARVGNNSGGGFGSDGINVETKHAYLWFEVPGMPNASLTAGIQNVTVFGTPTEFFSDDMPAVKLNLKMDPVDLELIWAKLSENTLQNADDNDLYAARLGINVTKDLRLTLEGMVLNEQCFDRVDRTNASCGGGNGISADFGDTFWVGATASAKLGTIALDGAFLYGQRTLACVGALCGGNRTAEESGWGMDVAARIPVGPLTVNVQGWYTSGDDLRGPASAPNAKLVRDSDKLPSPNTNGSWYTRPLIAEAFAGFQTIGGPPGANSQNYAEKSGTYGIGASAIYAVTPALSLGGGAAYVGATDAAGPFGDNLFELDGGLFYTINANVSFQGIVGYIIPDEGDNAWAALFRTRFAF